MARISLRTYHREIETLIERGQYDQAIAHCKHIIQTFPKNISTYRLLGKCFLESQHYANAADIFQRVLSSVPDDFLSHVGISMIREDEGNLNDAIWNMERAFEVQPANSAIQAELRRLYGRRDGYEPPKLRLTRGALARMYVKGELYQQAIAELRAALGEEPERLDLLTLLAETYFASDKRVEAAETSSAILQKLPYSLAANRILAEVLANSERSNEAGAYRQRVLDLDPYQAHTSPVAPTPEQVPGDTITIERLSWRPGHTSPLDSSQPDWASSLGVNVSDSNADQEDIPDWLVNAADASSQRIDSSRDTDESSGVFLFDDENEILEDLEDGTTAILSSEEEEDFLALFEEQDPDEDEEDNEVFDFGTEDILPEWMSDSNWGESEEDEHAGQAEPEMESSQPDSTPDVADITPGEWEQDQPDDRLSNEEEEDIPEWLQSLGGPEEGSESDTGEDQTNESSSSWLDEEEPEIVDHGPTLEEARDAAVEEEQSLEMPADITEAEGFALDVNDEDLPEWLKDLNTGAKIEPLQEDPSDTRTLIDDTSDEISPAFELNQEIDDSETDIAPAEIPDWLKDLKPAVSETAQDKSPEESEPISEEEQEAAFAWLEGLAAKQGVDQNELFISSEQQSDSVPEWIQNEMEASAPEGEEVQIQPEAELSTQDEQIEIVDEEEYPEWKIETSIGSEETEIQALSDPEQPEETDEIIEMPDWLKDLAEEETPTSTEQEIEAISASVEPGTQDEPVAEAAEIPDWLQSLAPQDSGQQEDAYEPSDMEAFTQQTQDDIPDLEERELDVQVETPSTEPYQQDTFVDEGDMRDEELPEWLMEVVDDAEESAEDELPDWLTEPELDADRAARVTDFQNQMEDAPEFTDSFAVEDEPPVDEEDTQPSRLVLESEGGEPPDVIPIPEELAPPATEPQEWIPEDTTPGLDAEAVKEEPEALLDSSASEVPAEVDSTGLDSDETTIIPTSSEEDETIQEPTAEIEPVQDESAEITIDMDEDEGVEYSLEDADAAFAWLESLAAKQGAEEALLLSPEERSEEPPDWVKEAAKNVSEDEEQAFVGFDEFSEPAIEVPSDLQTSEQETWEQESETVPTAELDADVTAEAEPGTPEEIEEQDISIPESFTDAQEESPDTVLDKAEAVEEQIESEVPELPDWLADIEEEMPAAESGEWTPPDETPISKSLTAASEPMFEQAIDINVAGLADLERLPGVGFVRAQAILAHRRAHGPIHSAEDLLDIEGFDADLVDGLSDKVVFAQAEGPATGEIQVEQATETQISLVQARNALVQDEISAAIEKYQELIEAETLLADIITDLNEALFRHPSSLDILQSLGDAYLRHGQVKDAIDAYTKAERLLH